MLYNGIIIAVEINLNRETFSILFCSFIGREIGFAYKQQLNNDGEKFAKIWVFWMVLKRFMCNVFFLIESCRI